MEQHPVPQNISSYEFRLVGDMTLKQFFQLAGGIIAALGIFRLPLPGIIKYPLVFLSVMVGVLMAFIPIQGRPFTQWITAFIRAIYAPTEFAWTPDPVIAAAAPPTSPPTTVVATPATPVPQNTPAQPTTNPNFSPPPPTPTPPPTTTAVLPTQTSTAKITEIPKSATPSTTPTTSTQSQPVQNPTQPVTTPASAPPPPSVPSATVSTQAPTIPPPPPATPAQSTSSISPPDRPNIVVGLVTTSTGQAIDGAIIEIVDSASGIPARALRTNRTGQFQIATPLPSGSFVVSAEKDGFFFNPVSIKVGEGITPPVIIKAQTVA